MMLPQSLTRSRTDPDDYLHELEDPQSSREFVSIPNLDSYFVSVYEYHQHGGFWSIVLTRSSNLVIIAFTIAFSLFLVGFVNWDVVVHCGHDKAQCHDGRLLENNLAKGDLFGFVVVVYALMFVLYFVWHALHFVVSLSALRVTRQFFAEKLLIDDSALSMFSWDAVMARIVSLQETTMRLHHNRRLDALDITNRILRKENYLLAMVHMGVLDFGMPKLRLFGWTLKTENRRSTNADVLRWDPRYEAAKHKHKAKHKPKPCDRTDRYAESLESLGQQSKRRLLASSNSCTSSETRSNNLQSIKSKIQRTLSAQKRKIQKLKTNAKFKKDRRRGYHHVGDDHTHTQEMMDEDEDEDEDGCSDASSGSDSVGHEYRAKAKAKQCDALFFEDYVNHRLGRSVDAERGGEVGSVGHLGSVLQWNLNYLVFESMFDAEMKVKASFKANSAALRWKFFWYGVANLVLTPFTLVFRIIFFFLENAEEMHSNRGRLFSFRQWTALAKLKLRELNELPHAFEARMAQTASPAAEYIDSFAKAPHVVVLSELASYVSGSVVAVLLLLTCIDSSILLNISVCDRSLVWFLALGSAVLALARSNLAYDRDRAPQYEAQMQAIARHSHYFPRRWQGRCHTVQVRDEFTAMYQPKLALFVSEVISVFTTPFVLMFTLPNCVDALLEFVAEYTDHIEGVGDICSYSRFDFERCAPQRANGDADGDADGNADGDGAAEADTLALSGLQRNVSSASNMSDVSSASSAAVPVDRLDTKRDKGALPLLRGRKMESSLLTFAMTHPSWRSNATQSTVLQNITGIRVKPTTSTASSSPTSPAHSRKRQSSTSASTAVLGLTFSELLAAPTCADPQHPLDVSQQTHAHAPEDLFNALQRSSDNDQHYGHYGHYGHASTSPTPRQSQSQHMMLSEINESDSSPRHRAVDEHSHSHSHSQSDMDREQQQQEEPDEPRASPYKSLAMETDLAINRDH